jgi:hypothetical protein
MLLMTPLLEWVLEQISSDYIVKQLLNTHCPECGARGPMKDKIIHIQPCSKYSSITNYILDAGADAYYKFMMEGIEKERIHP